MAGSEYYIRVAVDPTSIARAKGKILELSRLSIPNIDVRGQLQGQQGVVAASRAALELTQRRIVAEQGLAATTLSTARQTAGLDAERARGFARLREAEGEVLARKQAEVAVNQRLIAQEEQKAVATANTARQTQKTQQTAGTTPAVAASAAPVANVQRVVNEQRAMASSSNVVVRGLQGLSSELNTVGGSAFGAGHALAQGTLTMRQMAAATVETAARLVFWSAGAAAIFTVVEVLSQVKEAALDADEAMVNLSRVVPNADREQGGRDMIRLMRDMALGAEDVGEAMYQMGKLADTQAEATKGAEAVLLGTKIAELDVADASQQLIKVQRAYKEEAGDLTNVLDKLNDQQNRLGVDISKSLIGVSRAAGVTKSAGGDLDALVARITVLQRLSGFAPETVSRANQRLAVQLSTLKGQRRIAETLAQQGTGIKIVDSEGEIKSIDKLLSDIGARFNDFNATQQSEIALALSGGNQGGLASLTSTLLQNYGEVEIQTKNVARSQGSARQELETTMKSMRNQLALVGVEIQAIGVNLANSGLLEVIGLAARGLQETLEIVNDLLGAFNQIPKEIRVALVGVAALRSAAAVLRGLRGGPAGSLIGASLLAGRKPSAEIASHAAVSPTGATTAATGASGRYAAAINREAEAKRRAIAATEAAVAATQHAATVQTQTQRQLSAAASLSQERLAVAFERQVSAANAAASTAQRHAAALIREAEAASVATKALAVNSGVLGRAGGALKGGNIIGGALLASIVGDVAQQYGKEHDNRTVERAGSVASGAGTGALIGSLLPGIGTGIGAAVGGAFGGGIAVMRSFQDEQKDATNNFVDLTASVRRLRAAQDRAADRRSEDDRVPRPVESDEAAARLSSKLSGATARIEGIRQLTEANERTQTSFNVDAAIENMRAVVENGPPEAAGSSRAQLAALVEVRDQIKVGNTSGLKIEDMLVAFPETASAALEKALKRADGGVRNSDASRIAGQITPNFVSQGLPSGYIESQVRSLGLSGRAAEDVASSVQQQLVRELLRNAGAALSGSGADIGDDYRAIADLQSALQGGFGVETQFKEFDRINKLFTDYFDAVSALSKKRPSDKGYGKAQDKAKHARDALLNQSFVIGETFGLDQAQFEKSINDGLDQERVPKFLSGFAAGLASLTTSAKTQFSKANAQQISGMTEEQLTDLAAGSYEEFKNYATAIGDLNAQVAAGQIDADQAVQSALANLSIITQFSKGHKGDPDVARDLAEVQSAFLQLINGRIEQIKKGIEAGTIDPAKGAGEILVLLSRVEAMRGRIPDDVRNDALAQISNTVGDLVGKQAERAEQTAKNAVSLATTPEAKRGAQRALQRVQAARSSLAAAIEAGGNVFTPRIVKALRDIGFGTEVIGALQQASVGSIRKAQRDNLVKQRDGLRRMVAAERTLKKVLEEGNAFMRFLAGLIAKRSGNVKELEAVNKSIAEIDAAVDDAPLIGAIGAGAGSGDVPSISGGGLANAAEDAKQRAEEARDHAMDLIQARFEFLKALAGDDPVRVARLDLQEAQELARFARDRAERFRAKAAIINARRALREAILDQAGGSQTFGIPTEIKLPNAFEVKAAAAKALRSGAIVGGVGAGGSVSRSEVSVTTTNRNTIAIHVGSPKDLERVAEIMGVATGADEKAMKSVGFSGGGLI